MRTHASPASGRRPTPHHRRSIVTAFLAPNSYTGEDLVEIAAHGSPVVLDYIVRRALLSARGARIAEPGEFSRRAFLAGRLDLTQAEAIHDLIAAQTLARRAPPRSSSEARFPAASRPSSSSSST